jgi:arsenate reductase-like glutaredoxin family protein
MKNRPPSRAEAFRLLAENPNLLRRPVLVKGREVVLGYDPAEIEKLAL